jgi:hypothetical protein
MRAYNLLKLVDRYGSLLNLVKTTSAAYDPATGSSAVTTKNFIFTGYMYNVVGGIIATDVTRGSRNVVIPFLNLGAVPEDGDQVSGLGDVANITRVRTYYTSGVTVCYLCEVAE